jgi:hypothetical protein
MSAAVIVQTRVGLEVVAVSAAVIVETQVGLVVVAISAAVIVQTRVAGAVALWWWREKCRRIDLIVAFHNGLPSFLLPRVKQNDVSSCQLDMGSSRSQR